MDVYQTIGAHLKRARLAKGMTQAELAEKAELSEGFVSFLESGKKKARLDIYLGLCGILGLSLSDLFRNAPASKTAQYSPKVLSVAGLSSSEIKTVRHMISALRKTR